MLKNEYRKAVKEYLVSLMIDKNNVCAYKGASKAYKNLHEYDKAIKHLKNARNVYGFDSEIYYELGLNYLLNADNVDAILKEEVGKVFVTVLEHAGVYKRDEKGKADFDKFINTL